MFNTGGRIHRAIYRTAGRTYFGTLDTLRFPRCPIGVVPTVDALASFAGSRPYDDDVTTMVLRRLAARSWRDGLVHPSFIDTAPHWKYERSSTKP